MGNEKTLNFRNEWIWSFRFESASWSKFLGGFLSQTFDSLKRLKLGDLDEGDLVSVGLLLVLLVCLCLWLLFHSFLLLLLCFFYCGISALYIYIYFVHYLSARSTISSTMRNCFFTCVLLDSTFLGFFVVLHVLICFVFNGIWQTRIFLLNWGWCEWI